MKNRGFSLIEIVVAVAIMGILSGIVGLQLRSYIAKSKDTKAVATLNTLRVAAQLYQVENEEALIDTASLTTYSEQKVKDALKKLEPYLDNNAKAIIEKPEMAIGGSSNAYGVCRQCFSEGFTGIVCRFDESRQGDEVDCVRRKAKSRPRFDETSHRGN